MPAGAARSVTLLPRVRGLFLLLVSLVLLAEVVEWLDAGTPLWPQRMVAVLGLVGAGGWAGWLHRRGSVGPLMDAVLPLLAVGVGWGLGRPGAVLALLVGMGPLRTIYGDRRSAVLAGLGLLAVYPTVGYLVSGMDGVLDLGVLTVATGLAGLVLVIRLTVEALAVHDLAAAWDAVLGRAAEDLLRARGAAEVEAAVERALGEVRRVAAPAAGGLLASPVPAGAVPASASELTARPPLPRARSRVAPPLEPVLRQLEGYATLARERIASEERFRLLAEQSRDGIYVLQLRPSPVWRYLNPAALALLGIEADEAVGDPEAVFRRVHPEDRGLMLGREGVIEEPVRLRLVRPDGTQVRVEVRESVLEHRDGHAGVVQGMARDVTRQWEHERALERAAQQQAAAATELRRVDEMKSTFLRAVSHELRTPLTAVLGAAVTLRQRREDLTSAQTGALLDAIHRQSGRLERLLEDLLDVDRLSRGIIEPERRPTELLALVRRVVETIESDTHPIAVDGERLVLAVDGPKVERIVENLVRNALIHTASGTPVRVRVLPSGDGGRLIIEDDGAGVPEALRRELFEPFAQGPATRRAASPGTGIGLALVSQLTRLHGGEAWVEDAPGGGARFVVALPAVAVEAETGLAREEGARDDARLAVPAVGTGTRE